MGSLDALTVALLVLTAGVYARGWAWLRRRMPFRFDWSQLVAFMVGLDVLFVALAPPLEPAARDDRPHDPAPSLDDGLLLWLGLPLAPLLRGLPAPAEGC